MWNRYHVNEDKLPKQSRGVLFIVQGAYVQMIASYAPETTSSSIFDQQFLSLLQHLDVQFLLSCFLKPFPRHVAH